MNKTIIYKSFIFASVILCGAKTKAQKDTTKNGIDIISSFKPVLRESAEVYVLHFCKPVFRWAMGKQRD